MSASMQPEYNRSIHKQIAPKYNPDGVDETADLSQLMPRVSGTRMEGNYYSSRPASVFNNEERRQEAAVRSVPAGDFDTDVNSAYALGKTSLQEKKEADAP